MTNEKGEEEVVEPNPDETQSKTFTQEEVDAERERIKQGELAKYQGLQKVVSRKDQRIKELETKPMSAPAGDDSTVLELLLQERKSKVEFGENDPMIPRLEAELAGRKQKAAFSARIQKQQQQVNEERNKVEQRITDAGLNPTDDDFVDVWESFEIAAAQTGNFSFTDRKLDRILNKVKQPKTKEVEGDKFDKAVKEEARKMLESTGQLKTETGGPSASSMSALDAAKAYIAGEISAEEAIKRGATLV